MGGVAVQGRLSLGAGRWQLTLQLGAEWVPLPPKVQIAPAVQRNIPSLRLEAAIGVAVTIP